MIGLKAIFYTMAKIIVRANIPVQRMKFPDDGIKIVIIQYFTNSFNLLN